MKANIAKGFYQSLPRLETTQLVLRKAKISDVPDIYAYASDIEVTRYLRWGPHLSLKDTENYINEVMVLYHQDLDGPWVIEHRCQNTVIGHIHLMELDAKHRKAQVGFVLSRSYWNQGIITVALSKVLEYSFAELGLNRVEGLCIKENRAAERVLEKAGMKNEGMFREYLFQKGAFWDFSVYAILRKEFQKELGEQS